MVRLLNHPLNSLRQAQGERLSLNLTALIQLSHSFPLL